MVPSGVDVNIPVFTGGLLSARDREAVPACPGRSRSSLEDQETQAARDVYTAWFEARTAYRGRLPSPSNCSTVPSKPFNSRKAGYNAGTSSIVELSQAELQQIQAQITAATSRFDYQVRRRALDFQLGALK